MDPFALLGINRDADEAAIKRAYAQRLRKTRPDDDPAGFQRLNEAYRTALAYTKARQGTRSQPGTAWRQAVPVHASADPAHARPGAPGEHAVEAETVRPAHAARVRAEPVDPPPAPPNPMAPVFDPAAFIAEFRQRCDAGDARALSQWLSQVPSFWNLPTKHTAGRMLLRALFEQPEHMSEACFAATSGFFHFDDALAGIDPMLLRRVRDRGTIAWLLRAENHAELARRIYGRKTPGGVHRVRTAIRLASGSPRLWRDLLFALPPGRAPRHATLLLRMCNGNIADLPPPIDPDHAKFWVEAGGTTFGKPKLLAYVARTIAALLLIPAAIALFTAVVGYAASTPDNLAPAVVAYRVLLGITLAIVAIIWACVGAAWFARALESLGLKSRRARIMLFSLTPAWCCIALLIAAVVDPVLGVVTAIAILMIAFLRSRSSARSRPASRGGGLAALAGFGLVLVMMGGIVSALARLTAATGAASVVPTLSLVAITIGIWAWDWRKRGFLAPRQQTAR